MEEDEEQLIYRVVYGEGSVLGSNSNHSGMYDTLGWARNALRGFKGSWFSKKKDLKVQYATVVWHDLQED